MPINWFNNTNGVTAVTPTDRSKSVRNRCIIGVFGGVFYVVKLLLYFSVSVGDFVIGLSQISSISLFEFQLLGECHCWWTKESPRTYLSRFFGRFQLIGSVLIASNFRCLKFIEIEIFWVYYTSPLA